MGSGAAGKNKVVKRIRGFWALEKDPDWYLIKEGLAECVRL